MATTRRNGQLSSCEPCRKSKLRCDHQSPHCSRCLRNGHPDQCFYHPAPLTQTRTRDSRVVVSRRPKRRRPENQSVFRLDRNVATTAALSPASTLSCITDETRLSDLSTTQWTTKKKRLAVIPGQLGLASPQDIFAEYEENGQKEREDPCHAPAAGLGDSDQVQRGAEVLSLLVNIRWFYEIIEFKNKVSPGWFLGPPLTRNLCTSIEETYDSAVRDPRDIHASLLILSRRIFANTDRQIQVDATIDFPGYVAAITPRWDTIGHLIAVLGAATFFTPDDDPIYTHRNRCDQSKDKLRMMSNSAAETCFQFCKNVGVTSDPFCWLVTQQTVLLTMVVGDTGICSPSNDALVIPGNGMIDYRVWEKLGDLSTIVYGLRLHQPSPESEDNHPFFLAEIRKRVMVCTYALDKQLATALGWPPRICSRYCDIQMPLDLTYDEIVLPLSEKNKAMRKLDTNGWNTEGRLTTGVRLRIVLLTSLVRESILELSMSPHTDDLSARVEGLIEESCQTQRDLPFMRHSSDKAGLGLNGSPGCESRDFANLEFIHQEFLLHRILLKRLGIQSQSLLNTSHELIATLLGIVSKQMRSSNSMENMSWDLCSMGLPAAGILTSHLLCKDTIPMTPPSFLSALLPPNFRSTVIQNLSVLASHLTSLVQPHDGNYEIARQGANFISRTLDQVLSTTLPDPDSSISESEALLEDQEKDADGNVDFTAWLDGVHWEQDSWLNFT